MDAKARLLEQITSISSHSHDIEGVERVGEIVAAELTGLPLKLSRVKNATGEYADAYYFETDQWQEGRPNVLLVGHIDTVFTNFGDFDIRIEGNKLYGPGVCDMKAGIVILIETAKRFLERGQSPGVDLGINLSILITTDEEQGTAYDRFPDFKEIAEKYTHLMVFEPRGDVSSDPNFNEKDLVVSRKGIVSLRLDAKASGGHSGAISEESKRHNAIHELTFQAEKIKALADYEAGLTTNIGVISGGNSFNIMAEEAYLEGDTRMITAEDYEETLKAYQNLPNDREDSEVALTATIKMATYPIPHSAANEDFFILAEKAASRVGLKINREHRGGGSDANRLGYFNKNLSILDGLGPIGNGEHTIGEFVYLDSIDPAINLAYGILEEIASSY